ncbi:MAG: RNA polymerase sporulation sigma factor SigK [Lawsonibacter sp.]
MVRAEVLSMLSPAIYLIMNGLFFTLRLSGGGGSFPRPLKAAEERECLERWAQGDIEARNELVEHNLRLVAHIVKKYYAQSGDQDDLISIGTIGLIKGISTFKADKNVRLATYASRCIENEILMYFRSQRKLQGEVSLADTLESAGDGGSLSLMDVIAVDDTMLEELDTRDACQRVRRYVDTCLTPRERMIIVRRYGLDDRPPQTQREVATCCGISRSYVSRIEKKALEKLEQAMDGWRP